MAEFLIVGSGATGVHAAWSLLDAGHDVHMMDVGYERPMAPEPEATVSQLKERLEDPLDYFLGERGEAVVYPSAHAKPYGFPSSKAYVFRRPAAFGLREQGFSPMVSFARGGLAEAWTGGSYELRSEELQMLGMEPSAMRQAYATVAGRIGVGADVDDLQRFSPVTAPYQPPLPPDAHSAALLERYANRRPSLNAAGVYVGRSRVAVLSRDIGDRQGCTQLGRCLWGCPRKSLYAPGYTLQSLLGRDRFRYTPGTYVQRVVLDRQDRVTGVVVASAQGGAPTEIAAPRVILAAGALASTAIYLETLAARGEQVRLGGLMDNRHVMVPFVNVLRLGREVPLAAYQFHQVALGIDTGDWRHDVHGQLTTLKAAAVHPIVTGLPFDLRTAVRVFARIRSGLGVVNLWLADQRREQNAAYLERDADGRSRLVLDYTEVDADRQATDRAVARTRSALRALGCVAPAGQVRVLDRGSSVHYAGTLPASSDDRPHTTGPDGAVRGMRGLHVVDGAVFPWLPAKNLTFTLMANAVRIAGLLA